MSFITDPMLEHCSVESRFWESLVTDDKFQKHLNVCHPSVYAQIGLVESSRCFNHVGSSINVPDMWAVHREFLRAPP